MIHCIAENCKSYKLSMAANTKTNRDITFSPKIQQD